MSGYRNPFEASDPDRGEIWTMLVERDIEAFVRRDWGLVAGDFVDEGFFGLDAGGGDRPDAWKLAFPSLGPYRDAWLDQAERMAGRAEPEEIREGLIGATTLRDIELAGDSALAHKKFDGEIALRDGGRERLQWQTLYHLRRRADGWRIAGFVGYLPNPMGSAARRPQRPAKSLPAGAEQHLTAGPYSPVLKVAPEELVVISGQAAIAPDGRVQGSEIGEQTRVTLENCRRQLASAGCSFADVFKVNVFLTDLDHWAAFNEIYAPLMPEPKPVRTAVQAALLTGLLVEVEMWAASR